jgi:ABC-type phosphate transport system substrate-binding protein
MRGPVPSRGLRALRLVALALALACALDGETRAAGLGNLAVVANPETGVDKLDAETLARIYLGKKTLWDNGTRILPAMLDENDRRSEAFLEGVVKKSVSQYRAYWKRMLFSGGGVAPRTFRRSSQVLDFVARQPGGIGVVDAQVVDDRVKVVELVNE